MRTSRSLPRAFAGVVLAVAAVLASAPGIATARMPEYLTGTYELLAKDVEDAHGDLEHVYTDVLRVPGRAIPLRLPDGHGLTGGTRIRVSALRTGTSALDVRSVRRLAAPASTVGGPGTTSVLVILAYWTAPDSVTQARAAAQFFGDNDKWYREVSYGQAGLAGAVTPWVRVRAPAGGLCYGDSEGILASAVDRASAVGYDYTAYDRVVVYFPRCGGDATDVAGWAYQPGTVSWLNGRMDRRTTVHEQGHNYGLGHAKSASCTSATGTRVTYSTRCTLHEYGDAFDVMGRSTYGAHFTGYRKAQLGWLGGGRRRELATSSATFTLPPFERASTSPVVVVANSARAPGRSYWLEYRRPIGMDARLPSGATGGVLVHVSDANRPGVLLDLTPRDGTSATAVLRPGTSWTSPDYVKIAVGSITSTGARVSVSGARPAPTVPTAPRNVVGKPHDHGAVVEWTAPAASGGTPVTDYLVRLSGGGSVHEQRHSHTARAASFGGLDNGVAYTARVYARNDVGLSAAGVGYVTPTELTPSVRITAPAPGAVLRGTVRVTVQATPNPVSRSPVSCIQVFLDDVSAGRSCGGATASFDVPTAYHANGDHHLTAVAHDEAHRSAGTGPLRVVFANPVPEVRITSPATGTAFPDTEQVRIEGTATMPDATAVQEVVLYDVTHGYDVFVGHAWGTAPFTWLWDVSRVEGTRTVVAVARGANGMTARSAPVTVSVAHPRTVVTFTSPAPGATVRGAAVPLSVTTSGGPAGARPVRADFYADGALVATDTTAPFAVEWDTSAVTGTHDLRAVVTESSGRTAYDLAHGVVVDNVLPVASVTAPDPPNDVPHGTVRIAGGAAAGPGGVAPDRVEVRRDGVLLATVPVAADGTWTYDWESGARYGYHSFAATALTPEGLAGRHAFGFVVVRPAPSVAIGSPVDGATVSRNAAVEVVVTAAPDPRDHRTITEVCLYVSYWSPRRCVTEPAADGTYRIAWDVAESAGRYAVTPFVVMSDGFRHFGSSRQYTVHEPSGG